MAELSNYQECRDYLDKGIRKAKTMDRPIANNTRVEQLNENTIGILLHSTYIVKYFKDGLIELNSGGWKTVTTKDRMNRFAPFHIWTERHVWYVSKSFDWHWAKRMENDDNPVYHYQDQMYFDNDNKPWVKDRSGLGIEIKPFSKEAEKAKRKQLRKIDSFIKKGLKRLAAGEIIPSSGDCWVCQAFNGQPIADKMFEGKLEHGHLITTPYKDNPHLNCLQSHIDEGYFHFTLLMNAVKSEHYDPDGQFGNPNMTNGLAQCDKQNLSLWANPEYQKDHQFWAIDLTLQRLQKTLKRFIMKQLGI